MRTGNWALLICTAITLLTCSKKENPLYDNPADPESAAYVGREVLSPKDPANHPTVSITTAPTVVKVNIAATFVATATDSNPNGLCAGKIVSYTWTLGDGTTKQDTLPTCRHAYTAVGTYVVSVTAVDNDTNSVTATKMVLVTLFGAIPTADAGGPYAAEANVPLELGGTGNDEDGHIVKYEWDFDGNGVYDWSSTSTGTTQHTYVAGGTYAAILRVTDDDGNTATTTAQLSVAYDLTTAQLVRTLNGHTDYVYGVAVTPEGQTIVSGSRDSTIKVWWLATGELLRTLSGNTGYVLGVAVSPDGQTIVSCGSSTIKVWWLSDGQLLRTLADHPHYFVHGVAVSRDGQTIVSASGDKTIKVWRLSDGALLRTLTGHTSNVYSVAFTPDGQAIVSGADFADNAIKVWEFTSGKLLRTLSGHTQRVYSAVVTPDGQTIVSGSADGTIKVWRLDDGQILRTITGHTDQVRCVAVTPDGKTIVSGSRDNTIKLWRLANGQILRTLTGHTGAVQSVALTPDGRTIVSGSEDRTIKIWQAQ